MKYILETNKDNVWIILVHKSTGEPLQPNFTKKSGNCPSAVPKKQRSCVAELKTTGGIAAVFKPQ